MLHIYAFRSSGRERLRLRRRWFPALSLAALLLFVLGLTPSSASREKINARSATAIARQEDVKPEEGWRIIKSETFEDVWNAAGWAASDLSNDGYDRKWGRSTYRPHLGLRAAWPARGGVNGYDPTAQNNDYFNNMDTRMTYGPFDLSDAADAEVSFWLWRQIETCCDYLAFEVSTDGVVFRQMGSWSGSADWSQAAVPLDEFVGDASVWVAWRFYSNAVKTADGPWIDDILITEYVPQPITVEGILTYSDRNNNQVAARNVKVSLYDYDEDGEHDLFASTFTDDSGYFEFNVLNDDDDDSYNVYNHLLDVYVVWETASFSADGDRVTDLNDQVYAWQSRIEEDVPNNAGETVRLDRYLEADSDDLRAMWIFQDLSTAREYILNNTYPSHEPGPVTAKWEYGSNCYLLDLLICNSFFFADPNAVLGGPFIFVKHDHAISADYVIHEAAHHYMWNASNWWYPNYDCWSHQMFLAMNESCAWSEGWADFFPLMLTVDVPAPGGFDTYYDKDESPCDGDYGTDYWNLEAHGQGDGFAEGDIVEGRVAGALYDLFDFADDGFDSAGFGFDPIADIVFQEPAEEFFFGFLVERVGME
ncbi:MAG: hypothetical protein L0Z70_06855 [Chloroflexi bacterium]|nr:hypothetical protein [Chloroflexota bacterium]